MRNWLNQYSLSVKALLTGLITGVVLWLVLDSIQNRQLSHLLQQELLEQLDHDSEMAQSRFYTAVETHAKLLRLFAKQESIAHYLLGKMGDPAHSGKQHKWAPATSTWRGIILPSAFLLYDRKQKFIAAHKIHYDETIPGILTNDTTSHHWLNESLGTPVLEIIEGQPAVIISEPVFYEDRGLIGYISMFVKIDDHFMYNKLAIDLLPGSGAVLFSNKGKSMQVLASSDLELFPPGTSAKQLKQDYLFGGKGTFDQGDWGVLAKLFILLPKDSKANLAINVKELGRFQRFFAAIIFAIVFTLLMVLLGRRIQNVSERIKKFAHDQLNLDILRKKRIDAIATLEEYFDKLSIEVIESRNDLIQQHEIERRVDQLRILETITDDLRVGVLKKENGEWVVLNAPMQQYVKEAGGIGCFITNESQVDLIDVHRVRRIFSISHLETDEGSLILVNEVTELVLKTEELTQMALYDSLTGLPNRVLFNDRLNQLIDSGNRSKVRFSVMLMDLDRFKEVNDTLGHSTGDKLLSDVAYRLSQQIRSADTLARIGGDEFAILLPDADTKQADFVANKLLESQRQLYRIDQHDIDIGISIGIVTCPENGETPDLLMSRADMAMYHAKRNRLGRSVYKKEIDSGDQDRLRLISDLRRAILDHDLQVYYQPKLDMASQSVSGWEALVRWHHPERGWVSPADFIPLAEQIGLINEISSIVIRQAIKDCRKWQESGQQGGVAINLSTHDLMQNDLAHKVKVILSDQNLMASQVTFEVTESALMQDPVKAKHELDLLDSLGVTLSVDDFGTGYSSLGYLKHLPVSEIKIDQLFVKKLLTDANDEAIVHAVIGLAHSLQMKVVAEGVEDKKTLNRLHALGCDITQGYYLSRPVPFEQVLGYSLEQIELETVTVQPNILHLV